MAEYISVAHATPSGDVYETTNTTCSRSPSGPFTIDAHVETMKPFIQSLYVMYSSYVDGIYYTAFTGGSIHVNAVGTLPFLSYYYNSSGPYPFNGSTIPLQTSADGSYTISISLEDAEHRTVPYSITVVVLTQCPPAPILTILEPNNTNIYGAVSHYSTAILSVSGNLGYTFQIFLNGQYITSGVLTGSFDIRFTNLSGLETASAKLTDPAGNIGSTSYVSWTVRQFSDVPTLTVNTNSSQNTLAIDISGELGTTYHLTLSGAFALSNYTGTISSLVTRNLSNLLYGPTWITMSITNSAGFTTSAAPLSYTVPLFLSISGTVLTWNGAVSSYDVYRYNTDSTVTRIATTVNPFYDVSPYSGLTLVFYVATDTQISNRITLTLPVNTQALQAISSTEYISAGLYSDTSSNIIKTILNSADISASSMVISYGLSKLVNIHGFVDTSYCILIGPSGSTVHIASTTLSNTSSIYIAREPNTSKTIIIDNIYTVTIVFDVDRLTIGGTIYSDGDTVVFGKDTYVIILVGSVYLQKVYTISPRISESMQHTISPRISDSMQHTISTNTSLSSITRRTGTNVAEYVGGREMIRQVASKGKQQIFPDYSSYMRYLKGRAYIQRGVSS